MKKVLKRLPAIILVTVLLWSISLGKPVYAANFSNTPLRGIEFIKKLPNGSLIAVDRNEKVAVFDYLNWNVINDNGNGSTYKSYNEKNNTLIFEDGNTGYWGSSRYVEYDISNNNWRTISTVSNDNLQGEYCFSRGSNYYLVNHYGLYQLNGSSWNQIAPAPMSEGLDAPYYDEYEDVLYAAFTDEDDWPETYHIWKYDFSSNTWNKTSYSRADSMSGIFKVNGKIIYAAGIYEHSIYVNGNSISNFGHYDYDDDLYGDFGERYVLAFNPGNNDLLVWDKDGTQYDFGQFSTFDPNVVCKDKFGNWVIGGYSQIVTIDQGGIEHTDTGFYTDYIINDASISATEAKIAAQQAKAAADAAHSDAQNAADRTWYNGNESAYWAYYGKVRAQQARDNAANAHTDAQAARNLLNGSANGGKSLAATYDAASAASGNADYIRNTQLPSIENKIANLETTVNNINNSIAADTTSPDVDWATVSGAYSTSGSSIDIIISASDNVSSNLEYSINGGAYSALPADGNVSAPVTDSGPNAITVRVRDEAGNIGSKVKTIWKL